MMSQFCDAWCHSSVIYDVFIYITYDLLVLGGGGGGIQTERRSITIIILRIVADVHCKLKADCYVYYMPVHILSN